MMHGSAPRMSVEIERKFRVVSDAWRPGATGVSVRQGYLTASRDLTVRVRIAGPLATLTIKGPTAGITRAEFEYPIPVEDAAQLLADHCGGRIVKKTRYRVAHEGRVWEVDEFEGANAGLVLAEIELESEDDSFATPEWVGAELSGDPRFNNSALAERPWGDWSD